MASKWCLVTFSCNGYFVISRPLTFLMSSFPQISKQFNLNCCGSFLSRVFVVDVIAVVHKPHSFCSQDQYAQFRFNLLKRLSTFLFCHIFYCFSNEQVFQQIAPFSLSPPALKTTREWLMVENYRKLHICPVGGDLWIGTLHRSRP